jgi:hypothetical protein
MFSLHFVLTFLLSCLTQLSLGTAITSGKGIPQEMLQERKHRPIGIATILQDTVEFLARSVRPVSLIEDGVCLSHAVSSLLLTFDSEIQAIILFTSTADDSEEVPKVSRDQPTYRSYHLVSQEWTMIECVRKVLHVCFCSLFTHVQ